MAVPVPALIFGVMMITFAIVATALALTAATLAVFVAKLMSSFVVMPTVTFMMVAMMIAMCFRIIFQATLRKSFCCRVRRSLYTSIELDTRIGQRHLGTHTNTAAD